MPVCEDAFSNCPTHLKQFCFHQSVTVAGHKIEYSCPLSCGICSKWFFRVTYTKFLTFWLCYLIKGINATCDLYGSVCENGATCVNNPTGQHGFTCVCPDGFHGGVCEYSKFEYYLLIKRFDRVDLGRYVF